MDEVGLRYGYAAHCGERGHRICPLSSFVEAALSQCSLFVTECALNSLGIVARMFLGSIEMPVPGDFNAGITVRRPPARSSTSGAVLPATAVSVEAFLEIFLEERWRSARCH